ncbi:OsmC family protein [Crocinitomix catalasitica]|uniref:OsmC family protein n=1 Tax=Crocinitomix catalasitica TaxID=184607 RepID=UPI0004841BD7|nr:OsmC family protein [Crocinitomix catalasitica]
MRITARRLNNEYLFEAKGESGVPVLMDNTDSVTVKGASPMEMLLMGVAGCNAIDIIMILKNQKLEVEDYTVEVIGNTVPLATSTKLESMVLKIDILGDIPEKNLVRAASLSFEKYCSVALTLRESVEITYSLHLNGKEIAH